MCRKEKPEQTKSNEAGVVMFMATLQCGWFQVEKTEVGQKEN